MSIEHIAVLGGGAWGTALAQICARRGRTVTLWEYDASNADYLASKRESRFLPGVPLEDHIGISRNLADAAQAQVVLLVVPAQAVRSVATALGAAVPPGIPVLVCAKGIERGTRKFMTDVVKESAPKTRVAILSGPSFAADVARGLPTAVTLGCADAALAGELAQAIGSANFRPYHTADVRGVEIGGATKNVLAIAAGIVAGRALGPSAGAALISRGFAELMRFGKAFGAKPETLTGLSGLGDLVLTCSSPQSRNFSFGFALGQGMPVSQANQGKLAEGAFTAPVLMEMASERKIDMPIHAAVAGLLSGRINVDGAIKSLLARPYGVEE